MRRLALALILALAGCSPANVNDAEYWSPSAAPVTEGEGDDDAAPLDDTGTPPPSDSGSTPPPASATCLSVEITTVSVFGRYTPSHVAAVWITDASGKFIKTLREWGVRRSGYLYTWRKQSGGSTVDAVTGATLKSHGLLTMEWNCTDAAKKRVAPGKYVVHAEFTESNGQGPLLETTFDVGATPNTQSSGAIRGYSGAVVKFTP